MRLWAVITWFVFTLSLAVWQAIFSNQTLLQLSTLSPEDADKLARHTRMVRAESLTMLVLLVMGGVALLLLIRRERRATDGLREFLATFTHELKTSLSSLRLQAEVLQDSLSKLGAGSRAERILNDLTRIDLQLENSLGLARGADEALLSEKVSLKEMISSLQNSFSIPIHLERDCELIVDRRVFESILKNLAQNASLHGKAQNLYFGVRPLEVATRIELSIEDDGGGSDLDSSALGQRFHRPSSSSKNGIGLYLVHKFCERMGGSARFNPKASRGFQVLLTLPGRPV